MMRKVLLMVLAGAMLACGGESASSSEPARESPEAVPEPSEPEGAADEAAEPAATPEPEGASDDGETEVLAAVSRPAPALSLPDQDGQTHSLEQYRGKVVVLEWINPRCPYVRRHYEAGTMKGLAERYAARDVVWLAIDSSHFIEPEASREWRTEHELPYPILQDPAGDVGRAYGARTTPHMYIIDAEGVLRYAGAIDDDPRGRSEEPTNYVAAALDALLDGRDPERSATEPYGCTVKYEGVD